MTETNKAKEKAHEYLNGYVVCGCYDDITYNELDKSYDMLIAELQKQHEEEMSRILFGNECFDICPEIQKLKARIKEMEK